MTPRRKADSATPDVKPKALPKEGTQRRLVLDVVHASGARGMTDDEIEKALALPRQPVSAARGSLCRDGMLRDSGLSRQTRNDATATVWVVAGGLLGEPVERVTTSPLISMREDVEVAEKGEGWLVKVGGTSVNIPGDGTMTLASPTGKHLTVAPVDHESLTEDLTSPFATPEEVAETLAGWLDSIQTVLDEARTEL